MAETYRQPVVNNRPITPVDLGVYSDIRFDPSDVLPIYIGLHLTNGAATTDPNWKLFKFTLSGSDTTRIQVAYAPWDSRVGAF